MSNITEYMMDKLQSVGFQYPDYAHEMHLGMLYAYDGKVFCFGGYQDGNFSEEEKMVASKGQWLPNSQHLLEWLNYNNFSVSIIAASDEKYYRVCAIDSTNDCQYTGGGLILSHALHKLIYKICKSKRRDYDSGRVLKPSIVGYDHLTEIMMARLQSVGFRFPDFEHELNSGMFFSYQNKTYCIGGWWGKEYSQEERNIVSEGLWLPDSSQLLRWLIDNDFSISIDIDSHDYYFHVFTLDSTNGCQYAGEGQVLSYALYDVIYKICKAKRRKYIPDRILTLDVINDM